MLFHTFVPYFLVLFAGHVAARSYAFPSSITSMQVNASTTSCSVYCARYQNAMVNCTSPHCGCTVPFLQAQGECLVCQTTKPQDAAAVQFLLDAEISQSAAIVQSASASLRTNQMAFLSLQIAGGHIGLAVVLGFAIFSRKVRRDPTFLNFCITWILSSVMFSILLYRGTNSNTPGSPLGLLSAGQCLAQAARTEGAQVMTACSTLALVIQLFLCLRTATYGGSVHGVKQTLWLTCMLLAGPYILFIAFAIPSALFATNHVPGTESPFIQFKFLPTNFYCAVVEIHPIAYGTVLNRLSSNGIATDGKTDFHVLFIAPIWVDMLQAAIPLVAFLVFGINSVREVLLAVVQLYYTRIQGHDWFPHVLAQVPT
ncbi:hypothetical protein JB92DRAFT_3138419 [Gautieria morchelliformis]|nr:hypothetical protein JB92DRAFT_3138419 [Gautieria morchelliformis]